MGKFFQFDVRRRGERERETDTKQDGSARAIREEEYFSSVSVVLIFYRGERWYDSREEHSHEFESCSAGKERCDR